MIRARTAALALGLVAAPVAAAAAELLGAAIYERGEGAGGRPVEAVHAAGGWRLRGSVVACANCHGRQREGGREGSPSAPSLRWVEGNAGSRLQLEMALVHGRNGDGRDLDATMPRFRLASAEFDALFHYLAEANAGPMQVHSLPLYVTLLPRNRLADEEDLLHGLQACLTPLVSGPAQLVRWELREYADAQQALNEWRRGEADPMVAAWIAPSLRGWKNEWAAAVGTGDEAPPVIFPFVDDPLALPEQVPVHWLFGGPRERQTAVDQARAAVANGPRSSTSRLVAVPALSVIGMQQRGRGLGTTWGGAVCTALMALEKSAGSAPGGLAGNPARRTRWALQRLGRIETPQGLSIEPASRIAVADWDIWEVEAGRAPILVIPSMHLSAPRSGSD